MTMMIVMGVVLFGLFPGWLLPVATAITGYLGYKASKDATKAQSNAQNAQLGFEQAQAARMAEFQNQQMSLANAMAFGGDYSYKDAAGNVKPVSFQGYAPQADEWTKNYLQWLQTSPDVTYNQQRGRMERDVKQGMEQAAGAMGQRGMSSGIGKRRLSDLALARSQMLGGLEADRVNRQGERLGAGTQLTQSLYDKSLAMRQNAMGMPTQTQTMVPQMMMDRANQTANQAGAWGNLATSLLGYQLQQRQQQPNIPAPTTVPQAPPAVQVPNQFYDFRYFK
jgi:hypothetical protein